MRSWQSNPRLTKMDLTLIKSDDRKSDPYIEGLMLPIYRFLDMQIILEGSRQISRQPESLSPNLVPKSSPWSQNLTNLTKFLLFAKLFKICYYCLQGISYEEFNLDSFYFIFLFQAHPKIETSVLLLLLPTQCIILEIQPLVDATSSKTVYCFFAIFRVTVSYTSKYTGGCFTKLMH